MVSLLFANLNYYLRCRNATEPGKCRFSIIFTTKAHKGIHQQTFTSCAFVKTLRRLYG